MKNIAALNTTGNAITVESGWEAAARCAAMDDHPEGRTSRTSLDDVTARLDELGKDYNETADGVMAQCPVHDDNSPSLSITDAGDKLLWHCFAGCEQEAVRDALGIAPGERFKVAPKASMFRYVSTDGAPLRKSKSRSGPDKGKWKWEHLDHRMWCSGTGKHTPLPYRWDQAVEALADGAPHTTLHITEGESDADALTQWAEFCDMGVVAMSLSSGATNRPSEEVDTWLRSLDRFVVVIDNDDAGERRGDWFREQYPNVTIERPSHGKDLCEMFSLGHVSEDDFLPVRDEPPFQIVNIRDSLSKPPREWLVGGLLFWRSLASFFGPSGHGKSLITWHLACCIVSGRPFFGHKVRRGRVLWVFGEAEDEARGRMYAYEKLHGKLSPEDLDRFDIVPEAVMIARDRDELIKYLDGYEAVFYDSLFYMLEGGDNSSEDLRAPLKALRDIVNATGATNILIDHTGKDIERGQVGSYAKKAVLEAQFEVTKPDADVPMVQMRQTKVRSTAAPITMYFDIESVELPKAMWADQDEPESAPAIILRDSTAVKEMHHGAILAAVRAGAHTQAEIGDALQVGTGATSKRLNAAVKAGVLVERREGQSGRKTYEVCTEEWSVTDNTDVDY